MKQKIINALKTEFKNFGLSNEAYDRIASALEKTVTKEEEIADALAKAETMKLIASELQKMRDTEIQKRTDLQREHDDYKAKHPDAKDTDNDDKDKDKDKEPDLAALIEAAVNKAVKPVQDAFDAYKSANSAKEAITLAKEAFYGNKWTNKFKDEANDAWDAVLELNEAKGGTMTKDELNQKATEKFNKAVQRKGVDATKPFEDGDGGGKKEADFSALAKRFESEGKIPAKDSNSN